VFGFNPEILTPIADRIGPELEVVLAPPAEDLFPAGMSTSCSAGPTSAKFGG
jgi:hypothetical protein